MPEMTPVGNTNVPPNPQQGLSTLSSILDIRHKRQGLESQALDIQQKQQDLQTGQYTQASAQATAQQDQQKAAEMQAVGNLTKQVYASGRYQKDDGTFDNGKFANDVAQIAPTYGQQIANDATSRAGEIYKNKQTLFSLQGSQRKVAGDAFGALAANPKATHADYVDAIENLRAQYPGDKDFSRLLTNFTGVIDPKANGTQLQQIGRQWAQSVNSPTAEAGAPNRTTMQGQQGLQAVEMNPQAVGGAGPKGPPMTQGVTPTVTTNAQQQLVKVAPNANVTVAPGANPTEAQAKAQSIQSEGISNRVSQALGQANNTVQAQDALTRAKAILESPGSPKTGANFESFKNLKNTLSSLGIDTQGADDMNTLSKNLARYEASRATASGLGGTDAARELAHAGSPNTQLDNKAALAVVNQSLATEKALQSYAKVQSKSNDPQTLLKNESDFRNIPHLVEAHEYGMSRNAGEADAYLKSHNISSAQMKASRAAIKEFDSR